MPEPVVAPAPVAPVAVPPTQPAAPASPAAPANPQGQRALQIAIDKEKALLAQRESIKAERQKLDAERAQHKDRLAALESKNLTKLLQAAGYTPDQIAEHIAKNGPGPDPKVLALEKELAELRSGVKDFQSKAEKAAADAKAAETAKATNAYKAELTEGIYTQSEKFPIIAFYKQGDAVIAEMQAQQKATGVIPSPEAAAAIVEERLGKGIDPQYDRLVGSAPILKRLEGALDRKGFKIVPKDAPAVVKPVVVKSIVPTAEKLAPATKIDPVISQRKQSPNDILKAIREKNAAKAQS